jgi:hypothetical protein
LCIQKSKMNYGTAFHCLRREETSTVAARNRSRHLAVRTAWRS